MNIQTITPNQNILPIEPTTSPEENSQQREDNLDNALYIKEETQGQKDEQRQNFVAVLAHQSKQTQVEIYLSVATNEDVDLGNSNDMMLESLRKTQEQNNLVKAYASYAESQSSSELRFS